MRCPECSHPHSRVLRGSAYENDGEFVYRRRRECVACGARWTSHECYEPSDPESAFRIAEIRKLLSESEV